MRRMDEGGTQIVVDEEETVEDDDVFTNDANNLSRFPPPVAMIASQRRSRRNFHGQVESPEASEAEKFTPEPSFAKLVRTVQFIKKWAKRAEREPDSARDEFLDRFKMNGPSIDLGFTKPVGEDDDEEQEGRQDRSGCLLIKIIKRRRHLILVLNPSGKWLYRCVCVCVLLAC